MERRQFLGAAAGAAFAQGRKRPNILLILTDQQTHDAWSGARNPWLHTPAMDSLAERGTAFANAICPYPVCSPSRSSIFTGRMPHETGVMINGRPVAAGMATMGEVFAAAGYETVYGGKWHLPKSFDGMTSFRKLIGGSSQGSDMDAPLATTCAEWLRQRPAGSDPFLMVASFMNPHDVCEWIRQHKAHREHPERNKYPPAPANMAAEIDEPEAIQYHRTAGYDKMSEAVGIASEWRRDDFRQYVHDYYRMVEAVDREIGRVLKALDDGGHTPGTLILFASDHGEGMGAHRWVQKASFYEESVRVPLIVAGPGVAAGRISTDLVTLADLMPTMCDAAGLKAPPDMRGISLLRSSERPFVVSELRYGTEDREGRMLRGKRYKYVVFNGGARPEQLFDLELDPGETRNLAKSETGVRDEHRGLLRRWRSQTGDSLRLPV